LYIAVVNRICPRLFEAFAYGTVERQIAAQTMIGNALVARLDVVVEELEGGWTTGVNYPVSRHFAPR